jgi:formate dehydrogenase subunit gamma
MRKSTDLLAGALLGMAALAFSGGAAGQAAQQGQSAGTQAAPARSMEDLVPGQQGGIQGQNIFDVKPEVKPDASSDPNYMKQDNATRNKVQPGNSAPMWRGIAAGMEGFSSLPKSEAPEAGILIQAPVQYPGSRMTTAGEAWRQVRNDWIIPYGSALVLIALGALAIFFFARGPIGHNPAVGGGGRRIERFTPFERSAHWANAIAFSILAISGLMMAFGKFFLLPVIGATLYGGLTYVLKNLHNFAGPVFAVSLVIVILTFVRDELPQRGDMRWLLKLGGVFSRSGHELPAHRFNAGEKVVFWIGAFILGSIAVGSGLVLDKVFPDVAYVRSTMQLAHMVHSVAAILMMCILALHVYLGTVGYRGAYTAMRRGYVDEAWAQEHHEYWHEEVKAGKIPAQRSRPVVVAEDVNTARPA